MFTITLSQQHLNVIGAGLGELPYKVAAPVVEALNRQLAEATEPGIQGLEPQSNDRKSRSTASKK